MPPAEDLHEICMDSYLSLRISQACIYFSPGVVGDDTLFPGVQVQCEEEPGHG